MVYSNVTVIIPTLNEEKNIKKLIESLTSVYSGINIIVADDGSKDKTREIVKAYKNPKITALDRSHEQIHGLTISVVHGIKITNTNHFIVMDGDLQHPASKIKELVELLNGADIVIGCRTKDLSGWHPHRRLISKIAITLGRLRLVFSGISCRDPVSGFFGGKTAFVKDIIAKKEGKFEMSGYKVLFDLLKLIPKNTKIKEFNYIFGYRTKGKTKMAPKHIWIYFKSLFR